MSGTVIAAYKVKRKVDGLFAAGNKLGANWTKRGRVWSSKAAMRSSLRYYTDTNRKGYYRMDERHPDKWVWTTTAARAIPSDWVVVELTEDGVQEYSAAEWVTQTAPARVRPKTRPETREEKVARLEKRVTELLHYEAKYAAILERCRNTPGPCFCGVHVTELNEDRWAQGCQWPEREVGQ